MFPANFDYHRAASVDEAIALLARYPGSRLLAGGHSLIPMMKLRLAHPPAVVDIGRVGELAGISAGDGALRIGALTRHAEIAASPEVRSRCPLLAEAAGKIGDPQVRNKGTIGGNVAHADPASDLPAVLVALGATLHLRGPAGPRRVQASDFFVGLMTTALAAGEILTAVEVPFQPAGTGSCYLKVEHPASGYAVCGAAAVLGLAGDGACSDARLAFNGIAASPVDAAGVVADLVGRVPDDGAIAAAMERLAVADPLGDVHASGAYRVRLARVYGGRALGEARERARRG
jgi:aerobic carbon-monoxide dehydrogenase medium subunit